MLTVAQFSDSHLFADKNGLHHGANVYQNLIRVCQSIAEDPSIDLAVFTGDLTQDHTDDSYRVFVDVVGELLSDIPVYYLAGNHDDLDMLERHLCNPPFANEHVFENEDWQFHFINSKSETPAGVVSQLQLADITSETSVDKFQFYFLHHHPKNVDYFIDRHGLEEQYQFWDWVAHQPNVKGIACGHVHRAMEFSHETVQGPIPVYTCPATSIQFAKHPDDLVAEATEPAYRKFTFAADGGLSTDVVYL